MIVSESVNLILGAVLQENSGLIICWRNTGNRLLVFPKGQFLKKVNGNTYCYFKYRDGQKVVSKYIAENDVKKILQQLENAVI